MNINDFISGTVKELDTNSFEFLKDKLLGEYINFSFIQEKNITQDFFSEKLLDYFEKLAFKTGKSFDETFSSYISNWDDIVKKNIPKEPQAQKGAPVPAIPRSRKYYAHAMKLRNSRNMSIKQRMDYSRIMMCLYMASILENNKVIEDFDFSIHCLNLDEIIAAMKSENSNGIQIPITKISKFDLDNIIKKSKFNLDELYCADTATFILTIILFVTIKSQAFSED